MTVPAGHGAQTNLSADGRAAANGSYGTDLLTNSARMAALVLAGSVGDGSTYNGATLTGAAPYDTALTNNENDVVFGGVEDSITAHAGGTQAAAYQLTKSISRVTIAASAADSVRLKPMVAGERCVVIISTAANAVQIFGAGTATINAVATATGISVAGGGNKVALFYAVTATNIFGGVLA